MQRGRRIAFDYGDVRIGVAVSDDARELGAKAGALVKIGSTVLGGGGGGKDDFAQGGGTNPAHSLDAISAISQSLLG